MNEQQKLQWDECQKKAAEIVASYRAQAPDGCDPVATWALVVVGVGTAVSAGGAAYSASQQKKAAKKAAGTQYNTKAELLGKPAQTDPYQVLQQLYSSNSLNYRNASEQANSVNRFNMGQAQRAYNEILPGFSQYQATLGQNVNSWSRGELSGDQSALIQRNAAQQGIQGGFGFGSQGARGGALGNLNLRNLGLSSLELSKYGTSLGMQATQNAKSLLPNLAGLQDFWLNPQQVLGINQQNVQSQNQFALANNQLLNGAIGSQNQALSNAAQQTYAAELGSAQAIGQAASSVGGLISGYGSNMGTGAATTAAKPAATQRLGATQLA